MRTHLDGARYGGGDLVVLAGAQVLHLEAATFEVPRHRLLQLLTKAVGADVDAAGKHHDLELSRSRTDQAASVNPGKRSEVYLQGYSATLT